MRKRLFVAFCLLVFGSAAMAEKVDTKWHCVAPKATHKLDVGDEPDHSYVIAQGICMATASRSGEKSGAYTEFQELRKESFTNHGRFDTTMDNGHMGYYSYEGSGATDITKPATNTWKIVGGTGKHKSMKGSGSCSGTRHEDGTSDWACTGTYSV
ncbi:MAG: hypothetical protein DMG80_02115 [Acidobacteria bacterium]|nr:MAG: hypothetical protein DMG80_02115 [Acidobacteriota bacterium]